MKRETITVPVKPLKPRAPVIPTKVQPNRREVERKRQPKHRKPDAAYNPSVITDTR